MDNVFAVNPGVNVLYVFENENAFISKRDAENYSVQTGQKFTVVERGEVKPKKSK